MRDGKKGKKPIDSSLLTDEEGWTITVEVFAGNPQDPKTFKAQIDQLVQRFGVKQVTWVGDRGMIKTVQISDLKDAGFHYSGSHTDHIQNPTCLKKPLASLGE